MDQFQTTHGKLLYTIYLLSSSNLISQRDKDYLKDLIISDDPKIFNLLDSYNEKGTQLTLKNDILALLWSDRTQRASESNSPESSGSSLERRRKSMGLKIKIPPKNIQKIEGKFVVQ